MSINQFVEMTLFMCLICFSIYDKMQGFLDESGLFIFFNINGFLCLTQKFKMASKSSRKTIFQKIASRLCRYPADQKFHRNHSISLRFQDKRVFVFNTEIQDGRQKWRENDFANSRQ